MEIMTREEWSRGVECSRLCEIAGMVHWMRSFVSEGRECREADFVEVLILASCSCRAYTGIMNVPHFSLSLTTSFSDVLDFEIVFDKRRLLIRNVSQDTIIRKKVLVIVFTLELRRVVRLVSPTSSPFRSSFIICLLPAEATIRAASLDVDTFRRFSPLHKSAVLKERTQWHQFFGSRFILRVSSRTKLSETI